MAKPLRDIADLSAFHDYLLNSQTILAVVGAGLSASSGLSTFRGSAGLWRNYSPIDLATPDAFQIDPGLVWQFYSSRRFQALKARPNKGHFALAELSRRKNDDFLTLTQNVDGLSTRAKHEKSRLLELHGSLFTLKCTGFFCNYVEENNRSHPLTPALGGNEDELSIKKRKKDDGDTDQLEKRRKLDSPAKDEQTPSSVTSSPDFKPVSSIPEDELPHCPRCNSLLRPGVVWFGESLPLKVIDAADEFLTSRKVDLVLVIGTSGTVWPAMGYVERVQKQGGKVVVFNTEIDEEEVRRSGGWGFKGDAAEWLPKALEPIIGSEYLPRGWRRM
jgi:NAD-dependent SIR2 family protein deacetylase